MKRLLTLASFLCISISSAYASYDFMTMTTLSGEHASIVLDFLLGEGVPVRMDQHDGYGQPVQLFYFKEVKCNPGRCDFTLNLPYDDLSTPRNQTLYGSAANQFMQFLPKFSNSDYQIYLSQMQCSRGNGPATSSCYFFK